MSRGSNLERVGTFNQAVILDIVRRSDSGVSRVELVQATGLSTQTVSNIVRKLLDLGLINETGKVSGGTGKPRTVLNIDPNSRYAVGIHLDPSVMTFVLLDLSGTVVARSHVSVQAVADPERTIQKMATAMSGLIEEAEVPRERVLGVGIAAPGPIDLQRGVVVGPPLLTGWDRVELRESLGAATGFPVFLDKDSTAATHAELWISENPSAQNFAFIYLGTGLGAGLVADGAVVRGSSNNVGEIGHIATGPGGAKCSCGRNGCVGVSIMPVHLVREAVARGVIDGSFDDADLQGIAARFRQLADQADRGDTRAARILDGAAARLARAVEDVANLMDADRIVFGGPSWSPVSKRYLGILRSALATRLAVGSIHQVELVGSVLGEDIAAIGAGCLVLDHVLSPRPGGLLLEKQSGSAAAAH
ncbi:ROK family transcriptional regulator [Paenarthrobacter sp. DKR-5]|uniref:ROK family transcriptional regulator n=1 Tax=Paenarthrobacter sp. DKR-5 TaxID=2835535 RepID=UPI001BDD51A2|nr:ROK family transcriptional regulator [Paenarthrobacter sp. DKR-5]MBT1002582.1 ROK family transcriptional regulator [Paenarthrobacter sp. DKR-5]